MLRYNDYKHDALQHDNPAMAISSRFDLLPSTNWSSPVFTKMAFGGVDTKVIIRGVYVSVEGNFVFGIGLHFSLMNSLFSWISDRSLPLANIPARFYRLQLHN